MDSHSIGRKWRDLSGRNNWEGLLDPLDIDLRHYILHYGQLSQATYDVFNSEKLSKYAGNCRYSKRYFFSKVGLEHGNPFSYDVTEFLYATSKASASKQFVLNCLSMDELIMCCSYCKPSVFFLIIQISRKRQTLLLLQSIFHKHITKVVNTNLALMYVDFNRQFY